MKSKVITFSKYPLYSNETPLFREQKGQKYISNGKYNDYPDYLSYLYNNSGIHNAIVTGKAKYIYGKGFQVKKDWTGNKVQLESLMNSINSYQTLDELSKKKIFEKTLYGGACYLIEWGALGKPISITLQPYNTVRTDKDCKTFWVSKNWTREMSANSRWRLSENRMPSDVQEYEAFNITKKVGKQILFIKDDNPATDIYPLPEYEAGKTSIETDIECGFFHLNNVKGGFSAGTMVTFFNGAVENEEEQNEIDRAFKKKASGTDNAGEILMNFQMPNTTPPAITSLRSNDLDKQYEQLSKDVMTKTLVAHRVSNGLLFGIKESNGIGGNTRAEFDLAWEHFCNTYVKPKQQEECEDVNYLLSLYGIMGEPLELIVLDPIGIELTTDTILRYLDSDSIKDLVYGKLGIERPAVEPIVPTEPTPAPFNKAFMKFQDDTILAKFMEIGESADDFDIVLEVGAYEEFAVQSDEEKIVEILTKNKKLSVKDLAGLLKISENQVYKLLDKLMAKNTLAVKYVERSGKIVIEVEEVTTPKEIELLTKWRYSGPKDSKNRDFCRSMLDANRLYTRSEIDSLNNDMQDFNTDVWKYKGGWYHDPARDVNVPQCRHYWQNVIVKRKMSDNFQDILFYDPSQERNENGQWGDGGGGGSEGNSNDYNPSDSKIISIDKDPVGTWKPNAKNDKELHEAVQKKLKDIGLEYSVNEAHTVWPDGSNHSSYYIEVKDKNDPLKTIDKIRISEHQTGAARKSAERNLDNVSAGHHLLEIEKSQFPERFTEKTLKQKITKVVEVPKVHAPKALKGGNYDPKTDKILETRTTSKGSEILKVERNVIAESKILVRRK